MVYRNALETSCRQTTLKKTASKTDIITAVTHHFLSWGGCSPILRWRKLKMAYSFVSCTKLSQCKMELLLLPMTQTFMGLLQRSQSKWIQVSQMQECKVSSFFKTRHMISNNCIVMQLLQNSSWNLIQHCHRLYRLNGCFSAEDKFCCHVEIVRHVWNTDDFEQ